MNTTTKVFFLAVAMFAIVGMIGFTTSAFAVPQPEPGNTKVYQFNMIARPNNYEGNYGDGDLCEVGTFSITREGGKSGFKVVPSELFDASLEDIIWDVDATGQAKIQFRVYRI